MSMSPQDRDRIAMAIHEAEARSSGQIVCVLAQSSADARALPIAIASIVALALPWLLVAVTAMPVLLALAVLLSLPLAHRALVPRRTRRAMAHRAAMEQFTLRGVARTKDRTGILIFVSLDERYARIIADQGIAARVSQAEWQGAIDTLVAHMRDGRIAEGFIAAIATCGAVLEAHFPRSTTGDDELPDRIYLI
jgi:putative membrane protein